MRATNWILGRSTGAYQRTIGVSAEATGDLDRRVEITLKVEAGRHTGQVLRILAVPAEARMLLMDLAAAVAIADQNGESS